MIKQHRKLSSWINALIAAGFVLEQLDEWGPSAEQIAAQPALEEEKERPMIFYCAPVNRLKRHAARINRAAEQLIPAGYRRYWQSPPDTGRSFSSYAVQASPARDRHDRHR